MKRHSQFSRSTKTVDGVTYYVGWHRVFGWVIYSSEARLSRLDEYEPTYLVRSVN